MGVSTRDRLRPAVLMRKVLLPPVIAVAAVACLLGAVALTIASGSRADASNPLAAAEDNGPIVDALSIELEGTPAARDIRLARKPLSERRRQLAKHPYFELYASAARRFGVPWVLVASVHYQETGFRKAPSKLVAHDVVMSIASQLHEFNRDGGLGEGAVHAVAERYGAKPAGTLSAAMVIERARAWRVLGTIPQPGRGELATPAAGVVGGCGYFGCPRPGHLHNGVDFLAPTGTPVHAADAGRVALVETIGESGGYGNFVCVQHRPHLATCYAHLSAVAAKVRAGAAVRRGQVIGLVGSTGSSSAPHLHFEVRRGPAECQGCAVDPLPLLSGDVPQNSVPKILRLAGEHARPAARRVVAASQAPAPVTHAPAPPPAPVNPAPAAQPASPKATASPARPQNRTAPAPAATKRPAATTAPAAKAKAKPPPKAKPQPKAKQPPAPPAKPVIDHTPPGGTVDPNNSGGAHAPTDSPAPSGG